MADHVYSQESSDVEASEMQIGEPEATHAAQSEKLDIALFPPLPTPKYLIKNRELRVGTGFISMIIISFTGLTHGVALTAVDVFQTGGTVWWIFLVLIYSEAVVALICLLGLALTDPGVVQRSPETCFPIPSPELELYLRSYAQREKLPEKPKDVYFSHPDSNNQDNFCARCLVWRRSKPRKKFFHCAVCQRCVEYFDHHCSVFGRCIAGTAWKGNFKYFVTITVVGFLAYLTTFVALVWSLSLRYGPALVIPVSIVMIWIIHVNFLRCRR